ncbi:Aspartic proteinase PCS1 [Spatholobus suberectus]|nr:Aspartic proteinase PCS1 [Spatholobus suberectus]
MKGSTPLNRRKRVFFWRFFVPQPFFSFRPILLTPHFFPAIYTTQPAILTHTQHNTNTNIIMAPSPYSNMHLFLVFLFLSVHLSVQLNHTTTTTTNSTSFSLSFPLTSLPLSADTTSKMLRDSLIANSNRSNNPRLTSPPSPYNYKLTFKYSMALIVNLPIGTPPQVQPMVLDTGSQLSWIQCHKKAPKRPPPTASFDPSLSSTFSILPCTHPLCKPRIPDFTLPTSCDQNRLCHYSYFYADGTYAEGNLVREKFTFSPSLFTPPLILGCATESTDPTGILGMNRGRLSFASQSKITKFSYCVPARELRPDPVPSQPGRSTWATTPTPTGFATLIC